MSDMPTSSLGSGKPALLDISKVSEDSSKSASDFSTVLHGQMPSGDVTQGGNVLPKRGEVVLQNRQLQSGMRIKVSEGEPSEEGLAEFALSQGIDPRALMMLQGSDQTNSYSASDDVGRDGGIEQFGSSAAFLRTKLFEKNQAASIASSISGTKHNSDVLDAAIKVHALLNNLGESSQNYEQGLGPSLQLSLAKDGDEQVAAAEIADDLSIEAVMGVLNPSAVTNDLGLEPKKSNQGASNQNFTHSVDPTKKLEPISDFLKGLEKFVKTNDDIAILKNSDSAKINDLELKSISQEPLMTRPVPSMLVKDSAKTGFVESSNSFTSRSGGSEVPHTITKLTSVEKVPRVTSELTGKYIDLLSKEDQLVTKPVITGAGSLNPRDFVGKVALRVGNQDLAERLILSRGVGIVEKLSSITVVSSSSEQISSPLSSGNNTAIVLPQSASPAPVISLTSESATSATHSQPSGFMETSQDDLASDIVRRKELQSQLSQRLAQALGQRLVAQIERGSWRVEMDLHPSSLGRVEVQLEMRNGELEANFLSSNPTTRDLLQESLPRLREMLDQFGTNTAYQGMGSGYKGQSDGNPASDGSASQRSSDEEGKLASSDMVRKPLSEDGLDVLV
ncbi:MAG: hypothetical protein CBC09_08140 [Cellvibrionales bacterium TMED49]|nr:hypothetical protein [Porticoccaceae bacterium]OUU36874.1 MAG: hypothetical protein CBC09_08140 [Cellvibrionales bacterium TMED49]